MCMYEGMVAVNATRRLSSSNEEKGSVDNFASLPAFQCDNSVVSSATPSEDLHNSSKRLISRGPD